MCRWRQMVQDENAFRMGSPTTAENGKGLQNTCFWLCVHSWESDSVLVFTVHDQESVAPFYNMVEALDIVGHFHKDTWSFIEYAAF